MDADSESRQGVLAAVSANLAAMNYTLAVVKAKLVVTRNLRIKGQAEQPKPTRCSRNPFSLHQIYTILTRWSTKPQDIKEGEATIFRKSREKMARTHF